MWGWFGGGAAKKKDSAKDAILKLREQLEMLQKKEKHLEGEIAEQDAIARKMVQSNKNGSYWLTTFLYLPTLNTPQSRTFSPGPASGLSTDIRYTYISKFTWRRSCLATPANSIVYDIAALTALRRKKIHETHLASTVAQINTIEQQMHSIETANLNFETLKVMQSASDAMKKIHNGMNLDKVDMTMYVTIFPSTRFS